jgi:hypothetical protein
MTNTITLNTGVEMPALGFAVFQTPAAHGRRGREHRCTEIDGKPGFLPTACNVHTKATSA